MSATTASGGSPTTPRWPGVPRSTRSARWRVPAHILIVLFAAAAMVATVRVEPASAHGSTIDPASRNYGCWKRWGNDFQNPIMATQDPMCWQAWQADTNAMWNWNGLYREGVAGNHQGAIPNGQLCSGGLTSAGRYAAMDTPGLWQATNVGNNFTLVTHDQARHGANYYRVYVTRQGFDPTTEALGWDDLELRVDTGPVAPGAGTPTTDPVLNGVSVSIPVSAPGRTGRHIVFTIWQAAHADQSYYFCADVIFGGSTSPSPSASASPTASTSPSVSVPPSTSPSGSVPGSAACTATYQIMNSWSGGFQGETTVRNTGTVPLNWRVTMTFPSGVTISALWNGGYTQVGSVVSVRNASYNGNVQPGQAATFGFTAAGASTPTPTLTCAPV